MVLKNKSLHKNRAKPQIHGLQLYLNLVTEYLYESQNISRWEPTNNHHDICLLSASVQGEAQSYRVSARYENRRSQNCL